VSVRLRLKIRRLIKKPVFTAGIAKNAEINDFLLECRGQQRGPRTVRHDSTQPYAEIKGSLASMHIRYDVKRREPTKYNHLVFGQILRFFGWWLAFAGIYSSTSVCPFCGRPCCPVGAGSAGLFGGFLALIIRNWKGAFKFFYHKLFKGI